MGLRLPLRSEDPTALPKSDDASGEILQFPTRIVSVSRTLETLCRILGKSRETREGWPLLTVETETNEDSRSTN
jgi:hypothetical protein